MTTANNNTAATTPISVGIDRISFATPHYYLNLTDLANARGIDPNKFTIGIGQSEQSVPPNPVSYTHLTLPTTERV